MGVFLFQSAHAESAEAWFRQWQGSVKNVKICGKDTPLLNFKYLCGEIRAHQSAAKRDEGAQGV